jgi:hypothetical protein
LRRRRKASTIHGWLRMWRGTLAGNERTRQLGRREMKDARAMRRGQRRKAAEAAGGNSGPFALFRWGSNRRNGQTAPATAAKPPQRHISSSSKPHRHASQSRHAQRPTPAQRKSSTGSKSAHHHSRSGHTSSRPEPTRQRSTHSSKSRPRGPSRQSSGRR